MTAAYHRLKPIPLDFPVPALARRAEFRDIALSKLVVDERYQRAVGDRGRANIRNIAANFNWAHFAPMVVAPVGADLYAIIDGQHRGTAALSLGNIETVPCMVVHVTPDEAAACFAAINGQVTGITPGQLWKARVTAGDTEARALQKVLKAADVKVLDFKAAAEYRVGETLSIGTIEQMFKLHGAEVLTIALQAITQTGDGNPGCVRAPIIKALCNIVAGIEEFQRKPTMLYDLMDEISLDEFSDDVRKLAAEVKRPYQIVLRERLSNYLANALADKMEAAAA